MASTTAVLRKKANKQGQFPIAIRITKDRKSSFIYLGQYIDIKYWDEVNHKVRKSHPNSSRLNNLISKRIAEVNEKVINSETDEKEVSARKIKKQVKRSYNGFQFFEFATRYLEQLDIDEKFSRVSAETPRIKHFMEFVKNDSITFQEISESLLKRFQSYLKATRNISHRTILNHLVVIRSVFSYAIKEGDLDKKYYPFGEGKIQIKFPESIKVGLSRDEVKILEDIDLPEGSPTRHALNIWLLSFYFAGMRASDIIQLKWSDFQNNRLYYQMNKNNKTDSVKISDKAIAIIEKYINQKELNHPFVFPELKKANLKDRKDVYRKTTSATNKFDKHLKTVAKIAGINKNLSMHIARHTFGNISGDKIPIQMLKKLYRHSSITTTIGYQANFIFKDTDEALDSVVDF